MGPLSRTIRGSRRSSTTPTASPPSSVLTSPLAVPGHDSNGGAGVELGRVRSAERAPRLSRRRRPHPRQWQHRPLGVFPDRVRPQVRPHAVRRRLSGCQRLRSRPRPHGFNLVQRAQHVVSKERADAGRLDDGHRDVRRLQGAELLARHGNDPRRLPQGRRHIDFSAEVDLLDGQCASGALLLDDISVRMPLPTDAGADVDGASTGIVLVPDADGHFDGSNAAGVIGHWWATGDYFADDRDGRAPALPERRVPRLGLLPVTTPTPLGRSDPLRTARECAPRGLAAQVLRVATASPPSPRSGETSSASTSPIPAPDRWSSAAALRCRRARHHRLRVRYRRRSLGRTSTRRVRHGGNRENPAYWDGAINDLSPITAPGHYEMRWAEIGGPTYLGPAAPPFDPRTLKWIQFHVVSNISAPVPYGFCVSNATLLTN